MKLACASPLKFTKKILDDPAASHQSRGGRPGALQATDAYKEALRVYEEHAGAAMALVKLHLAQGQAVDGQVRAASELICNTKTADAHPLQMPVQNVHTVVHRAILASPGSRLADHQMLWPAVSR